MAVLTVLLAIGFATGVQTVLGLNLPVDSINKHVHIPVSTECDFGETLRLRRDWMEGYYTDKNSYIRLYMSVFDINGYPTHKDIWQDKSGNIVIYPGGSLLWIGFGRPARQISFARKYVNDGLKTNNPLIRSFLVKAKTITDISRRATAERFISRGLDINVDTSKSANQFGLDATSVELLRQNALSHSMVTYYLKDERKDKSWGRTEAVSVLEQRVNKYNMDREIEKYCDWALQELFPIKQDILSAGATFDFNGAEKQSSEYKSFLIRRKVILTLIEEIKLFFNLGGRPYRVLNSGFDKNVVKNSRNTDTFKLGKDLTQNALDMVEESMTREINRHEPSNGADRNVWNRFRLSVDQVKLFAKYSGTEIRVGNPQRIIREWKVFENYRSIDIADPDVLIPNMPLSQDSTNIGIRMTYHDEEDADAVCDVIKNNFIGSRIDNLQLISPLYDRAELLTYAKRVADCLERGHGIYTRRAVYATVISMYGVIDEEYRFYPDTQVAWSNDDKGETLLLFNNGVPVNLCIQGRLLTIADILENSLQTNLPVLKQTIDTLTTNGADGVVFVPQQYIKWPPRRNLHLFRRCFM